MGSSEKFSFIGNNLAIDLVNTQVMEKGEIIDLLQTAADVAEWADASGHMIISNPTTETLAFVLELRKALKTLFEAFLAKRRVPLATLAIINRYLVSYQPARHLSSLAGKFQFSPANDNLSLDELLGKVAYAAAQLLVSPQSARLKKCANNKCVLMFLDTSRANRRCWCSMKTCGNRAKVASHYKNLKV